MLTCSLLCLTKRGCITSLYVIHEDQCILLETYLNSVEKYHSTKDEDDQTKVIVLRAEDPCQPNPCHEEAQCIRRESGYNCLCPANRKAKFCDEEIQGKSCLDIQERYKNVALLDGYYKIGGIFKAYCEMASEGGGWTEVVKIISNTNTNSEMDYAEYSELKNANAQGNYFMTSQALQELHRIANFTKMRFKCRAAVPGRTMHLETKSRKELDYLMGVSDVRPEQCQAFEQLQDDTSELGSKCAYWSNNAFLRNRLLDHTFFYI